MSAWQYSWGWILVVAALLISDGFLMLRIRRSSTLCWRYAGGRRLLVDVLMATAWAWCELGLVYAPTLWTATQFSRISISLVAVLPIVWLAPIIVDDEWEPQSVRKVMVLGLVPLVTVVLAWTSGHHDWLIKSVIAEPTAGYVRFVVTRGVWYWVHVIYTYIVSALALTLSVTRNRLVGRHKWLAIGSLICGTILLSLSIQVVLSGPTVARSPAVVAICLLAFSGVSSLFHMTQSDDKSQAAEEVLVGEFPDALLAIGVDGTVADMNADAERVLHVSLAFALGRNAAQVFAEEGDLVSVLSLGRFSGSHTVALGMGRFEVRRVPRDAASTASIMYVLTDITERAQYEDDQRRYQAMLQAFLNQSGQAVVLLDEHANILSWNPACTYLTGLSSESVCGRPYGLVYGDLVSHQGKEGGLDHQRALAALRGDEGEPAKVSHKIIGVDGREHALQTDVVCFDTPLGRRVAHISFDITDIRAAERHREILLDDLERASHELDRLRELLPVCAWCGKVRDDEGYWKGVEEYVSTQFGATVSHSMCPDCQESIQAAVQSRGARSLRRSLDEAGIHPRFPVSDSGLAEVLASAGIDTGED